MHKLILNQIQCPARFKLTRKLKMLPQTQRPIKSKVKKSNISPNSKNTNNVKKIIKEQLEKKTVWSLFMDGVQLSQDYN